MSRNRVLLLCVAIMLALAINANGQTPAQSKAVSETYRQWLLPLDKFSVISDDNYAQAIKAWRQVSRLLRQRIDSLAAASGLSFHEVYKLVEAQFLNHPFMAKKAAYERLKDKEWKENQDMNLAIISTYMNGATLAAKDAMLAEISFTARDKPDAMSIAHEYYTPVHSAYEELLAKSLEKGLLDKYRLRCLQELDSAAWNATLSCDVDERINKIVGQRLQRAAAEVAAITTIEDLDKYYKNLSQLENEIVESESIGHSSVWRNYLGHAISERCYELVQARHAALWDDMMGRMSVVARPIVESYVKAVKNTRDHDKYCRIFYDYSKKINKGGELYKLLQKNGFSKEDIDRFRHEYIRELEQY